MTLADFRELVADMNPDALLADGLEGAIIGYTLNHHGPTRIVYDFDLCVDLLASRDGMTVEDANEYLHFNTLGAYVGENGPVYIQRVSPK